MDDDRSSAMPDPFDHAAGSLDGFPHTRQATIADVPLLGVGGSRTFIVQTFRVKDVGDTVLLQAIGRDSRDSFRLVIPPKVTALIANQRDALTSKARRAGARAGAATRKKLGLVPGFMKSPLFKGKRKGGKV